MTLLESESATLLLTATGTYFLEGEVTVGPVEDAERSALISTFRQDGTDNVHIPLPLSLSELEAWVECARCIREDAKASLCEQNDDETLIQALKV